ncbi:hypothetical protein ACRE_010600 [Hapsidospora chrysogenum ATCC 11550]|uniref:Uncharacterized protein n=1 Tax=Hapsidospora chrysogenum (strain ATCC 11550 / CBS 779.69 / DSM 880 / IAM 14645 / JCM 23072 / IMI 49137) TaxID=857340 RepID=A0A086TFC6_HAPC1|nr:hypothetical protein ACRE_010600 [Hapsidospora chrysogenum ATCC 11550]
MHQPARLPEPLDAFMYFAKLLPRLQGEIMVHDVNQLPRTRREMVDEATIRWDCLQFARKLQRKRASDTASSNKAARTSQKKARRG